MWTCSKLVCAHSRSRMIDGKGILRVVPAFVIGLMASVVIFDRWGQYRPRPQTVEATLSPPSLPTIASHLVVSESYSRYRRGSPIPPPPSVTFISTTRSFSEDLILMVLIFSEPDSSSLRDVVRATWLNWVKKSTETSYMFMVGVSGLTRSQVNLLEAENNLNKDMVLLPTSSMKPYTSQLLVQSLKWAVNNVVFKFLLQCNDQSYVTSKRLMMELPRQPQTGLIWGYFSGNEQVTRKGIKAESTWNLCSTYLPYPQGGGYVLSHDVVAMVADLGPDLDYLDHADIALGVWLSPFKNIRRIHDIRFNSGPISRGCHNSYFVSHPENLLSMSQKYKMVKEANVICQQERELLATYTYNWTATVINCCNKTVPMIPMTIRH